MESIERRGEDVYLSLRNDGQGTSFQWYYGWDSVKLALSTNRRIELETPLEVPLF